MTCFTLWSHPHVNSMYFISLLTFSLIKLFYMMKLYPLSPLCNCYTWLHLFSSKTFKEYCAAIQVVYMIKEYTFSHKTTKNWTCNLTWALLCYHHNFSHSNRIQSVYDLSDLWITLHKEGRFYPFVWSSVNMKINSWFASITV